MLRDQAVDATYVPIRDLVSEANHRIANSLAAIAAMVHRKARLIDPAGPAVPPAEVLATLAEVRARLETVARLHRALSNTPCNDLIDVGAYLQPIAAELVATLASGGKTNLHFACELGCKTHPERAHRLGQVVVELVTNALKYAHPACVDGRIEVMCRRDADNIVVRVEDDGVGLPEGFDPTGSPSYGMRLVRTLVDLLDGSVRFQSNSLGLRVCVVIPVAPLP